MVLAGSVGMVSEEFEGSRACLAYYVKSVSVCRTEGVMHQWSPDSLFVSHLRAVVLYCSLA